ncbi:MAG TPA: fumarylacetoacetase, partial [Chthoniobacterales bacterium]|nr:fumarylacetoacetase [Chthoniobacterales bacterium]
CFLPIPVDHPFPIQNLPYGVFSGREQGPRVGVAIGDYVLDLSVLAEAGLLPSYNVFAEPSLNALMSCGREAWNEVRATVQYLLDEETPTLRGNRRLCTRALIPVQEVTMHLPVAVGDYTDFYSSKQHATNVGSIFRDKNNPLLPNWLHLPVAYHGRASSLVVSGTPIRRPYGQTKRPEEASPAFGPSLELDFELEIGYFIGQGNILGDPISVTDAQQHLFGLVLVNDWSARDLQRWEYVPLGPFLAKNFGTSISPWVVPFAALQPFRVAGPKQDPTPLPYLSNSEDAAYDIFLEVKLQTSAMAAAHSISRTNFKEMYWSIGQQVAHHTLTGCNLRLGDLLASGTLSGSAKNSYGSLLELAWAGKEPLELPNGERRSFLEDGDTVILTGYAQGDGYRIGLGEVRGTVLPAKAPALAGARS